MNAMRTYFYRVLLQHGEVRQGFLRLAVELDFSARLKLESQNDATVLTLVRLPDWTSAAMDLLRRLFRHHVRREDLAGFLRDLGLMLGAGVPIFAALDTLGEEARIAGNQGIASLSKRIHDDLNAGLSLGTAFGRNPDVFPETVRNLILIGDQSSSLPTMMLEAARHVERMTDIRRDIRTALIYPAFVFATIFGVAFFWLYYVVPNLAQLFKQLHAKLPPITLMLIQLADWLTQYGIWILIATGVCILGFAVLLRRNPAVRHALHKLLHRLPIARVLMSSSGMAHITEHLAILVRAGLDIVTCFEILTRATRDGYYQWRLGKVREAIMRGDSIAVAMRRVGGFPAMAVRMIAVGEESGGLDQQLSQLAEEYRKRLEIVVGSLSEIIKPAVILLAGGLFLFLVVALLLPVYDLIRQSVQQSLGG
ncbi:MAG: type II secretion system F family protein [Rhodoferax sp.]|uniref:type II secretion system F family protein n=1 Tax=Rhodoferax sp. TaxID=50421 RepID=UPI002618E434|nr:type II secretion system F family protein [Rhodoferax sp.]MDD5333140.1 type II secretion system F family protein [Rhodoferax sp.]